ncbi:MAG: TetR/AcrR family transcriptional regulator [Anaerolineae bacterium]|jgi:TetR/AcrR family transcriptional repressor of lmrAB and yxaGH operons|nr:TetR/AcrR family transcriptional regulator [Anaerolineae bacterium]
MSTREQIIETTSHLLEQQGYYATGLNQIVQESGAPKGSLYYYFPQGKEELTAEAIDRSAREFTRIIETELARYDDPAETIYQFMQGLAEHAQASDCRGGAPIATVALETAGHSERLTAACQAAYGRYQSAFAARFVASGFSEERAAQLATLIVAAIEGGMILSRTQRSAAPLQTIAGDLRDIVSFSYKR